MKLRSFKVAALSAFVAVIVAGSAQTASAAGTLIHQYRLNEWTGFTDDFGGPSVVPIVAADPDAGGPLGLTGVTGLGSNNAAPVPPGTAAAPGCAAGTSGTITRLCQGYAFGFGQGLTLSGGLGNANQYAGDYSIVLDMLISNGAGLRKLIDFENRGQASTNNNGLYIADPVPAARRPQFWRDSSDMPPGGAATSGVAGAESNSDSQRIIITREAATGKGAPDLAIRDLNLVLANYPDHALALARLGEVHLRRRNFAAARAAFDKAGAADPRLFEALRGRVNLAMMEKRAADANALVEARLARSPEDVDTLMLGARIYAAQGNFDRQETALMKVIEVQPGNMSALAVLANLYVDLNKLDSALVRYQELSSGPMAVGAQTMLGLIYQTQNKPLEARAVFEKLLAAKPDTHVAANNLAWIYAETGGNLDGALQLAQDAVRMNPGSADYNDTLGWIYLKKDLASPAIAAFQTALRARPQSPEFHYHLGLAYRKADQPERAIQELQTALRYKADMRDAQVALDAVRAESKKKPS